jgi:regulator of protease activity HflC (stomatin/prohibitin superfamily)
MPFGFIILAILFLIAIAILIKNIRIVQQAKAFVVERLGAYQTTWNVGLHFKIPFIERVAKVVSLKEDSVVAESVADHTKMKIARWAIQQNLTVHDDQSGK